MSVKIGGRDSYKIQQSEPERLDKPMKENPHDRIESPMVGFARPFSSCERTLFGTSFVHWLLHLSKHGVAEADF